jgi:hypothetical protein
LTVDANSRASANVTKSDLTTFREFVLVLQNDVNMRFVNGDPVHGIGPPRQVEHPESTAQAGFNYRTEPAWFRMKYAPETPLSRADNPLSPLATVDIDFTKLLSNSLIGADPQTPIFNATPGKAMRPAWSSLVDTSATTSSNCTVTCGRKNPIQPLPNRWLRQGHNHCRPSYVPRLLPTTLSPQMTW